MKRITIIGALVIAAISLGKSADAQFKVGVNINIGSQPEWGPSGYDYAQYYFLPEIETYYYVPRKQFIYMSNGGWVFSSTLPERHRGYDLYSAHKVVINRPSAYMYLEQDRRKYGKHKDQFSKQDAKFFRGDSFIDSRFDKKGRGQGKKRN